MPMRCRRRHLMEKPNESNSLVEEWLSVSIVGKAAIPHVRALTLYPRKAQADHPLVSARITKGSICSHIAASTRTAVASTIM
jgi:hypothetical protein